MVCLCTKPPTSTQRSLKFEKPLAHSAMGEENSVTAVNLNVRSVGMRFYDESSVDGGARNNTPLHSVSSS
jgi:hypothetical protein